MKVDEWVGPHVERSDKLGERPAVWLQCPNCTKLFPRPLVFAKRRDMGHDGKQAFCTKRCARDYSAPPVLRDCAICGAEFRVYRDDGKPMGNLTCPTCTAAVAPTARANHGLVIYAYEHGIMADYAQLSCDTCGAAQSYRGKARVKTVMISNVAGKYVATCRRCREAR